MIYIVVDYSKGLIVIEVVLERVNSCLLASTQSALYTCFLCVTWRQLALTIQLTGQHQGNMAVSLARCNHVFVGR